MIMNNITTQWKCILKSHIFPVMFFPTEDKLIPHAIIKLLL